MAESIHPAARIGHVHLKVSDLDRAIAFYSGVLGFEVMQRFGPQAAFLSAGGYHHHIGLNTWESLGAPPAPRRAPGLYHTAILYPDRAALGAAVARLIRAGVALTGAADHGVSRDRPEAEWPRDAAGRLAMVNARLDIAALVAEAERVQAE